MTKKRTAANGRVPRRRTVVVFGGVMVLMSAFAVRLVDIQLVNADELVAEAQTHTGTSKSIAGVRGSIVDETGKPLALSTLTYDAIIDPSQIAKPIKRTVDGKKTQETWEQVSAKIGKVTGQSAADIRAIVSDNQQRVPGSQYSRIKTGLSTTQRQALAALAVPYLSFDPVQARTYPDGAVAGNLVGFVGKSDDDKGVKGQTGLEVTEQGCLAAKNGTETYQYGTNGEMIPGSLRTTPAVDGGTLKLTIDADLQWYMSQMIAEEAKRQGAKNGSVTVVEVETGKIRAAAEWPAVDPNNVSGSNPDYLYGQIFRHTFEPGSTFKAATAAMLLESGTVDEKTTVQAPGSWTFDNGARVNDSFQHETYDYTLAGALIDSSNVGLSMFGSKMSPEARSDYLKKFGVGEKTAVNFGNEEAGLLPDWKGWDNQSQYATTFGQHFTVTVPQVASFYQTIANDGVKKPLQLVESCTTSAGDVEENAAGKPERVLSEKTAKTLNTMIENVAEQGGVADLIKVPGYRIAAKTGTAQVPGENGYKQGVYFTSIVGYAPADDPKYVVMVTLNEPTRITTSTATATAFQKAMTQVMKTYGVAPSATPFTDPLSKFGSEE